MGDDASGGGESVLNHEAVQMMLSARQNYLEALPIAAALVADKGGLPVIAAANERFALLDGASASGFHKDGTGGIIRKEPLFGRLCAFLSSDDDACEFAWRDGGGIGGRHFVVRLARLAYSTDRQKKCVLSLIDRTAEVENERSFRAEMVHDSLTGLPNRVAFSEAVEQAMDEAAPGERFAIVVLDLTRFSRINESMGSLAGDELLITVARRIVSTLRAGDLLSRIGGDEFAILMRLGDTDEAMVAGHRLQATMAGSFRLSEMEIRVDCALGLAFGPDGSGNAEDLIRNAQVAMKRAKQSGLIEVYQPGAVSAARRRLSLETELRRAVENDELTLAFQPLIDLESNRVSGFEALARWTHPSRGAISPVEFIPVAEETGLIVPLGRWALTAATRTLADWDARAGRTLDTHVAVNVSAIQFARDDVVAAVKGALSASGISGDRLTLELTESAIFGDPEGAMRALQGLKDLHAKIAMDDFGTGYSSLASLQKLPIDVLKIDRSFVNGMLGDRDSVAIVRAVLSLAEALDMETTAEGVETAELAQALATLGCTSGQGYHFARPLAPDDAFAYLMARNA